MFFSSAAQDFCVADAYFCSVDSKNVELKQKSMEQLQEYLWTESFPLVFVLAFMAVIEVMAIVMNVALRFRKVSALLIPNMFILPLNEKRNFLKSYSPLSIFKYIT